MRYLMVLVILLLSFPLFGQEPCTDTVFAKVIGDTVFVHHYGAYYNCCAVIEFEGDIHGDTVDIFEYETFPVGPCYCMCCFNLVLPILGLAPGKYLIRVFNEDGSVLFGMTWVTVPGYKEFHFLSPYQSPCLSEVCGDTNGDGELDQRDLIYLGNYLYHNGAPPLCIRDPNNDGNWDSSDFIYLGTFLFLGGPPPCSQ